MKAFVTILIIAALAAAGWFFGKPYLDGSKGAPSLTESDRVVEDIEPAPAPSAAPTPPPSTTPAPNAPPTPPTAPPKAKAAPPKAAEPPKSEIDLLVEKKYPMPEILPLMEIVQNWANVPANAYPPEVVASVTVPFNLVINGQVIGSSNVAPGTPLKPVQLVGDQLTIANAANPGMSTQIPVGQTDFKQRIETRYSEFVERKTEQIAAQRARAKQILENDPAKLAALTGRAVEPSGPQDDPRFGIVKQSISAGEVPSVNLDEAKSFTWNGSEAVGGEFAGTYDTVSVHFEVATIFGRFPVDYKALIQGGRVVGWIDPITDEKVSS